jgi:hypothetical protein
MSDSTSTNLRIYLAGKITKNGWREDIVSEAQQHPHFGRRSPWPVLPKAVFGKYDYVGPYFIGDDHGSFHGESSHGLGGTASPDSKNLFVQDWGATPEHDIPRLCTTAIIEADIVFAWLDSVSAFGTLFELGYAKALGKKIYVGYPKGVYYKRDMWFISNMADIVVEARAPGEALATALRRAKVGNGDDEDEAVIARILVDKIAQRWGYNPHNIRQYPGNLEPATQKQMRYLLGIAGGNLGIADDMLHIIRLELGQEANFEDCNKAIASFAIMALTGKRTPRENGDTQ